MINGIPEKVQNMELRRKREEGRPKSRWEQARFEKQ